MLRKKGRSTLKQVLFDLESCKDLRKQYKQAGVSSNATVFFERLQKKTQEISGFLTLTENDFKQAGFDVLGLFCTKINQAMTYKINSLKFKTIVTTLETTQSLQQLAEKKDCNYVKLIQDSFLVNDSWKLTCRRIERKLKSLMSNEKDEDLIERYRNLDNVKLNPMESRYKDIQKGVQNLKEVTELHIEKLKVSR